MTEPTHYEVLSLPQSLLEGSKEDQKPTLIKQAYHRALLRHHPDKGPKLNSSLDKKPSSFTTTISHPAYTIDQITTAYTILSTPKLRSGYNIQLRTFPVNATSSTPSTFQTGIETLDLDDLASEESSTPKGTTWFKPCRCGNERGFVFSEENLEEAGDLGELIVGCQDCSLWLRVCFAIVEEEIDAPTDAEGQECNGQDEVEATSTKEGVAREGQERRGPEDEHGPDATGLMRNSELEGHGAFDVVFYQALMQEIAPGWAALMDGTILRQNYERRFSLSQVFTDGARAARCTQKIPIFLRANCDYLK